MNSKFDLVIGLTLFGKKKYGVAKPHKENVSDLLKKKKKYNVNNDVLDGLQISASGESCQAEKNPT